nr:protein IWS1 homolog [Penaeus vannamei]
MEGNLQSHRVVLQGTRVSGFLLQKSHRRQGAVALETSGVANPKDSETIETKDSKAFEDDRENVPEYVGSETSETSQTEDSETSEAEGSETSETEDSETSESEDSETSESEDSETAEAEDSGVSEAEDSEMLKADTEESQTEDSETSETEDSETSETEDSETSETEDSETSETEDSETSETEDSETSETEDSETSETEGSETSEAKGSELSEAEGSELSEAEGSELSEAEGSELSEAEDLELTKADNSETPDEDGSKMSEIEGSGTPHEKFPFVLTENINMSRILLDSVTKKKGKDKVYCLSEDDEPYTGFALLTPYRSGSSMYVKAEDVIPSGCNPVTLWHLVRHGSNGPHMIDRSRFDSKLPVLRKKILKSHKVQKGYLCDKDVALINGWKPTDMLNGDATLSDEGKKEMTGIASRFRNAFSGFLKKDYFNLPGVKPGQGTKRGEGQHNMRSMKAYNKGMYGKHATYVPFTSPRGF